MLVGIFFKQRSAYEMRISDWSADVCSSDLAMLGAFLAFGLSRAFGRPFVETVVARRHWQRLDDWTGEHAAQMVFLARFLPVISFNLVNYAAGQIGRAHV